MEKAREERVTIIFRENMTKRSWLDEFDLPEHLSNTDFGMLWDMHPKIRNKVIMYGKEVPVPRFQQSYGRDYKFSGAVSKALPIPDEIKPFVDFCNWVYDLPGEGFNEILVNWYENGNNYIGSHSDDESQIVPGSPIVTITLAAPGELRKFRIRDKSTKNVVKDVLTHHGMVLVMGGDFQREFKHEIVKITGAAAENVGARISITLRQFK